MIRFVHPEAWLLVPIVCLLLRQHLWPRAFVGALRVALLLTVALLLADPAWVGSKDGRDVVLVLDRSASMPVDAVAKARELANELAAALPSDDRLGVVSFGRKPRVESVPQTPFLWPESTHAVDGDASDLAAAVQAALALLPAGRQGSLLVVSDGLHTGGDLDAAARQAVRQGVRVDVMQVASEAGPDNAVADISAPSSVSVGEPFAVSSVVIANASATARWRLLVDGAIASDGDAVLVAGRNVLQFRSALLVAGEHTLAVEVQVAGDARPENDRAMVVVRAQAPRRVLVVTANGREDRLTQSLRAATFEVVVAAANVAPLSLAQLDGFRAVVLADVAAADLPAGGMRALASWVKDLGGGLLMTGGRSSFGVGGYHRSPIEEVLPVTMEIREEQRRFGLAMAIALDCSGSMSATVGELTKMQLANRGAASAIELLSPLDAVAVLAVDETAHTIVPMQSVEGREELATLARSITVGGGGIFVGEALHAAAEQLRGATQQHKHLVVFADASDAEEPSDFETFVPELVRLGITVSIIGLGTATDEDAKLLQRIAELGGGRCQFVADAEDLPRVFAQETIQVARSSMVEALTTLSRRPGLESLGDMPKSMPTVAGYSLAWLRPRAELAVTTADDLSAPFLAHWHVGLGRAAAFLGEADGALSGELATWPHYGDFFATLVRWLVGGQEAGLFVQAWREGDVGVFSLEVEPERAAVLDGLRGVLAAPDNVSSELAFERVAPARAMARVPLLRTGIWRAAVQVAGESVRLPPLCLPYSPEFVLQPDARAGERTLRKLAAATGGTFEPSLALVFAGERRSAGAIDLGPLCAVLAVLLLLAEIAVRRLQIWVRHPREELPLVDAVVVDEAALPAPAVEVSPQEGVLGAMSRAQRRARRP